MYSRYADEMNVIIIMNVLRYEGLFSFAGSGIVNGALVFGSQPEIGQVNSLFGKRLKVLSILFLFLSIIVYFKFNVIYALSVLSVPIGLTKYYLRNLIISVDKLGLMNACVLISSSIYLGLVYIVDSVKLIAFTYVLILMIEVFLFRLVFGRLVLTHKINSKVRLNVRENLKQGLASSVLNNLDKLLFANVISLDLLPTFDLASKLKGVYSKALTSIWNIYIPRLNRPEAERNYLKVNILLFIATGITFVVLWFSSESIGSFFQIKDFNRFLLMLILFPVLFSFVLFKARILNARTENLQLVTYYRIIESFIKSILVPTLVLFFGLITGLKYGVLIYFIGIAYFIVVLRKFSEIKIELIIGLSILIAYLCFVL
jgi:hypothetical protein